jgi:hypothetical protein
MGCGDVFFLELRQERKIVGKEIQGSAFQDQRVGPN